MGFHLLIIYSESFVKQGLEALQNLRPLSEYSHDDRIVFAKAAADLTFIQSRFLSEQGQPEKALLFARATVQEYQRLWASLHRRVGTGKMKNAIASTDESLVAAVAELSISGKTANSDTTSKYESLRILKSWYISPRLFAGILHLSRCFADTGLLLEAHFYLDQCQKIADAVRSPSMSWACLSLRGEYAVCSGDIEQGLTILRKIEAGLSEATSDYSNVALNANLALHYMKAKSVEAGGAACDESLRRLHILTLKSTLNRGVCILSQTEQLQSQMADLRLEKVKQPPPKKTRVAKNKALKAPPVEPIIETSQQDEELPSLDVIPLRRLKGEILHHSTIAKMGQGSLVAAMALLDEASTLSQQQNDHIVQETLRSQVYLKQTFQRLLVDPVFSVLPESTVCCPAVVSPLAQEMRPKSPPKKSKTTKTPRGKALSKRPVQRENATAQDCLEYLPLAQMCLTEVLNMAKKASSTSTIHAISDTLSKILTMLSVNPHCNKTSFSSPQFLAYIIGKTLTPLSQYCC